MKTVNLKNIKVRNKSLLGKRVQTVLNNTLSYQWEALNDQVPGAPKSGSVNNFRIAAGEASGKHYGPVFQDSDLAKWMEAVSYSLALRSDDDLKLHLEEAIALVSKAQEADGYLDTYFTIEEPSARWTNLRDKHELYCAGHMIEAAVANYEVTGNKTLLNVACRLADHICEMFGQESTKRHGYPGHEEIELALIKLYHATNERKYLDLAHYFIRERGKAPYYFKIEAMARGEAKLDELWDPSKLEYFQAHIPVTEQEAIGHAVRAMYLYSGMTDVAMETGDADLAQACRRLWDDVVKRKMYITGGVGSSSFGEAFTFAYDLPNDTAYTETCASIGLIFWAHRMFMMDQDAKYIDIMERALYNTVFAAMALDGKKYFYVNPLEVWPEACHKREDHRHVKTERQKWYDCACCPPNIARLLTSIGKYVYALDEDKNTLFVNLYMDGQIKFNLNDEEIVLEQDTVYPWDGSISFTVASNTPVTFSLALRIPDWCKKWSIKINGQEIQEYEKNKGYAMITRVWGQEDKVELTLDMPVMTMRANPEVRADAGKVAIQRGPVVYCAEETDNGPNIANIELLPEPDFSVVYDEELLDGVCYITAKARRAKVGSYDGLYREMNNDYEETVVKLVPYYAWNNRGEGEMMVWLRQV
jgi:hypothetical protein